MREIFRTCPMCKRAMTVQVDEAGFIKYAAYGAMIQDAFPDYNPAERELIKSSYCFDCQSKLFGTNYGPEHITVEDVVDEEE